MMHVVNGKQDVLQLVKDVLIHHLEIVQLSQEQLLIVLLLQQSMEQNVNY